jgi:endonuclease YncB( thermonuclease family)
MSRTAEAASAEPPMVVGAFLCRGSLTGALIVALAAASAGCSAGASQQQARAAGEAFTCTPTRVWDGDGPIWCAEGPRVRLAGIAAREMDGTCSPGHPCPAADPIASRDHLARLVGTVAGTSPEGHVLVRGAALSCTSNGSAGGARTAAWCVSPTVGDLSCRMVADGMAQRWDRYWQGHRC